MRSLLTPKKRCRRPATGLAIAEPSSAEAPICCQDCGAELCCAQQRGVRCGRAAGGQQRHDFAELQRRIGARRQGQLVDRPGDRERDIDAARLGFQIDIQNRVDLHGVKEGDAALVDGVLRAEEGQLALRDVDASEQRRIAGGAAQVQVGLGLHVFGQRALQLNIGRGLDLNVEVQAAEQSGAARRACAPARRISPGSN